MNFVQKIIEGRLDEAKKILFDRLDEISARMLEQAKIYVATDRFENVEGIEEAVKRNPNIIRMGKVQKIRRRIRRNAKGRIVVQKNRRRSSVKGYRIAGKGNVVKRIPATVRLRKARLLKRSWKTTRKAKLRRTLLKRKLSMRRRAGLGLR